MRFRLYLSLLLLSNLAKGQTQQQNDSLVNVICTTINLSSTPTDSLNISSALEKHLFPYLQSLPDSQKNIILENIAFRLQRNCVAFLEFSKTLSPQNGDWQNLSERPKTKLNKESCDIFFNYKSYKYLEANGDTVRLEINNGYWIDHFLDGTYSKLKLKRSSDCEFEIEFIESNNLIRRNFSKKGDKYHYQILEKNNNKYLMTVEISGVGKISSFVIYL